ncbi:type 1 glutamine amidotransferase [Candidatus Woesearchaeota archaeon]|nr:type 1 glutamine amidotransferase [Candidatus Woesearchaeota archaeon]
MKDKKVLIVQNVSHESPGLIGEILNDNGIDFEAVDLNNEDDFPNPINYSAVFVFGGPNSANDPTSKMKNELEIIKQALANNIPYFGICLGMQTVVKAAGGEVHRNNVKEIGFKDPEGKIFEIELTSEGSKDALFNGIKSPMKIFHLHGETVKLTPKMRLLATGKYCQNQVVKVGDDAYGFQGHLEVTESLLKEWVKKDNDLKLMDSNSLIKDYGTLKSEYQQNSKTIINNFLQIAGLI